jgi:hypothetical protein
VAAAEFKSVLLDKPSGKVGYVAVYRQGEHAIYIKLEIGDGDRCIFGRSFHPDGWPS